MTPLEDRPPPAEPWMAGLLSRVLQDWAYLTPLFTEGAPALEGDLLRVKIGFPLPLEGGLGFRCERGFARLLADCLGDRGEDETGQRDSLMELANIFCSHLVSESWGDRREGFLAALPQWLEKGEDFPTEPPACRLSAACEGAGLEILLWGALPKNRAKA